MQHSIPKGTFDILPAEAKTEDQWKEIHKWSFVESVLRKTASDYGFSEIRTPIFEHTDLFTRGVGDSSDIVTKEMYTFPDKAGRSLTLRPEGTAAVMRAFIENKLYESAKITKLFYIGPMFRYERPQAGRYRQHHQFGAEVVGLSSPYQDAEMIDMVCEIYRRLGIKDLSVIINSVGDESSRRSYKEALTTYLQPNFEKLSEDSKTRFTKNILRILDSKDPKDQALLENAPSILDFLSEASKAHFKTVCHLLDSMKISYEINAKLVRGLDYYNQTVFEVTCGKLGAQNTIGAGGRYDELIKDLGGPALPAVGFASGIERILHTMEKQNCTFPIPSHPFVYIIALDNESQEFCFTLLCNLRHAHVPMQMDFSQKKLSQCLQNANSFHTDYVVVIGESELQAKKVKLKHMNSRVEEEVTLSILPETIENLWKTKKNQDRES
ncbi:MAG: histidine--tRNA ligase [Chlamydiae bacterium]|nr:histidine--tRNA ligase [Chlamydiota bacterium]